MVVDVGTGAVRIEDGDRRELLGGLVHRSAPFDRNRDSVNQQVERRFGRSGGAGCLVGVRQDRLALVASAARFLQDARVAGLAGAVLAVYDRQVCRRDRQCLAFRKCVDVS